MLFLEFAMIKEVKTRNRRLELKAVMLSKLKKRNNARAN